MQYGGSATALLLRHNTHSQKSSLARAEGRRVSSTELVYSSGKPDCSACSLRAAKPPSDAAAETQHELTAYQRDENGRPSCVYDQTSLYRWAVTNPVEARVTCVRCCHLPGLLLRHNTHSQHISLPSSERDRFTLSKLLYGSGM